MPQVISHRIISGHNQAQRPSNRVTEMGSAEGRTPSAGSLIPIHRDSDKNSSPFLARHCPEPDEGKGARGMVERVFQHPASLITDWLLMPINLSQVSASGLQATRADHGDVTFWAREG